MKFLSTILPVSARYLPGDFPSCKPDKLPEMLQTSGEVLEKYPWLAELAEVELLLATKKAGEQASRVQAECFQIAPGVELLEVAWTGFPEMLSSKEMKPEKKGEHLLIIPQGDGNSARLVKADKTSLLALKIVTENLDIRSLAQQLGVQVTYLQDVLKYGVLMGVLLAPETRMVRAPEFAEKTEGFEEYLAAHGFTLQWHITQSCDLNCRHCYDRSEMQEVSLKEGERLLDHLYNFCDRYHVQGQVTFTGGNPILHSRFFELYRAVDRGFKTALLANPTGRKVLEDIIAIRMPEFYQISLEGLQEHNDYIRGEGHFNRSMVFLQLMKELDVYSMVMLTLTRANLDQVIPLAELLRHKVDSFTFNRLAMVGEGASLVSAAPETFRDFLVEYQEAAGRNPIMRLKDNLFNLVRHEEEQPFMGGCTGYGCGAAFNFVSVLPDGKVQACRKFPSPIGDLKKDDLVEIYEGEEARRYRRGCLSCHGCAIRPVCGGCLAVSYGFNNDPFVDLDPYCFVKR